MSMKILGIETSCDETGICLLEANKVGAEISFKVLGDSLYSQIAIHAEYGGVFPAMAKRAHSQNILHLFKKTLLEADLLVEKKTKSCKASEERQQIITKILEHEGDLAKELFAFCQKIEKPALDAVSVTYGPGLEPALWVGVNFARALSYLWDIPIIPTNHMEGHIVVASLLQNSHNKNGKLEYKIKELKYPAIALLISGGHTELVHLKNWLNYEIIGRTRDDAVGEAFDKVARMLDLPYPGGPEISRLAANDRTQTAILLHQREFILPRPMLTSPDFDFSFSGLKTAVLYTIKKTGELSDKQKESLAREFEDAATEVLLKKTTKAIEKYQAKSLIIGGGVSSNQNIRQEFETWAEANKNCKLFLPNPKLSTDNAVMIALAGYLNIVDNKPMIAYDQPLRAEGNLSL